MFDDTATTTTTTTTTTSSSSSSSSSTTTTTTNVYYFWRRCYEGEFHFILFIFLVMVLLKCFNHVARWGRNSKKNVTHSLISPRPKELMNCTLC